ncbi:MAG: hypothetical protein ACYTF6_00215 [Planctomycetota bacterium]
MKSAACIAGQDRRGGPLGRLRDGVLIITIAKTEKAKPKRIEVKQ